MTSSPPIPSFRQPTQITPDPSYDFSSSDNSPSFTQNTGTRLLFGTHDNDLNGRSHTPRDYYDQLFSSDSDDSDESGYFSNSSISGNLAHPLSAPKSDRHLSQGRHSERTVELLDLRYLPEEEKDELLGHNQPIPKIMEQENSPSHHIDKIATFNIRNKYDHVGAAELLVQEDLAFLALQEPYISSNRPTASWQSFTKCELQSTKIDCFQTQHQVILVDTFKWGGKTAHNFESHFQGRFISMAFQFKNNNALGIISIYASSAETHDDILDGVNNSIILQIDKIKAEWNKSIPNISIIILGDFQETSSISDRDNIGKFRKLKCDTGILAQVEETHESVVRKFSTKHPYVTRFGEAGARGIDHIMVPLDEDTQQFFPNAYISRDAGATFFPSDHSMLVCEYTRNDKNNNEEGISTRKFQYSKLYNIKMKSTGVRGKNISLDDSQFKDSERFLSQSALYNEVQKVTGNDADLTQYHLDPIELRIDKLNQSLWEEGQKQHVCGKANKLVRINDDQALELSFIHRQFMRAVKEVMLKLKLSEEKDNLTSAGATRGRLRKGKGFRMFQNLPIPSKLRYLRIALKAKARLVEKAQNWLKEFHVRESCNDNTLKDDDLWRIINCIVKTNIIQKHANVIRSKMASEEIERETHVNSIKSMKYSKHKDNGYTQKSSEDEHNTNKPNFLPYVSDSMALLINSWLNKAGCQQGFNAKPLSNLCTVLNDDIGNWKLPLTEFWDPDSLKNNIEFRHKISENLESCAIALRKIQARIQNIQVKYRKNTLSYFLAVNTIDAFTRKVLHKQRSAPMTHSVIWDNSTKTMRPCVNEVEELKATQAFHGRWMGNTKATENCAFAKVVHVGKLGPRGVNLNSNRKLTMKDIPKLVYNGNKLSRKVKRAFLAAHNKHIAKIFKCPKRDKREFFYPFFLNDQTGKMNNEASVEVKLWKSLSGIPGKARHAGFQLATLGRFGPRWRNTLWKMIRLMLVMRFIPGEMKKIARYPIPKPGKLNEYRPISLCDDLYCFLNAIITGITSKAIEKAGLLHSGITSYRRGQSCATLVTVEQSFREDCVEGNLPTVQIDEDEEKFFDRICLEIILTSMRINGFPDCGFVEFKACMMGEKLVEIITCKGTAFAKFVCGLEQGNPDSPTIANLVIKMKHDVWSTITDTLQEIMNKDPNNICNRYKFYVMDKDDGEIWIYMMGYCDDNTKFISSKDENLLIPLVQEYLQLAGDLSMTTKIGRKSSKCEVQFFNISAELTLKLRKCWSTAWSFVHDAPIEEQVPYKVFLQESELIKFYNLIDYNDLTDDDRDKWDAIVAPKAHRHLGLTATMSGDTSMSSQTTLNKMYDRISQLKLSNMEPDAQRKCSNMLVSTMHSFVPVQNNFNQEELYRIDLTIASAIRRRNGISTSDCKHRIFLPFDMGGLGFVSTLETNIISTARELEIISNCSGLDSRTFRTRIAAIPGYVDVDEEDICNHARTAIYKLARYEIFLRDRRDGITNDIIEELAAQNGASTVGSMTYRDGNSFSIGYGRNVNVKFAFGSPLHLWIRSLHENNWICEDTEEQRKWNKTPFSMKKIADVCDMVCQRRMADITSFHSFFEWNNLQHNEMLPSISADDNDWTYNDMGATITTLHSNLDATQWNKPDMIKNTIVHATKIPWEKHIITLPGPLPSMNFDTHTQYGKMMNVLFQRGSPIIIATDGAHTPSDLKQTSSSFAVCCLDIRKEESLCSGEWIGRPMIPLLVRSAKLPTKLGTHAMDIAHGEGNAFLMQELAFDPELPRIVITDSLAIREQMIHIRDSEQSEADRHYIRRTAGGISKYLMGIVKYQMQRMHQHTGSTSNLTSSKAKMIKIFQERSTTFLQMARTWISETDENNEEDPQQSHHIWKKKYFDEHPTRAILKVDSHQLDTYGRNIKSKPRYRTLSPNLALLNANHHADVGAEMGIKLQHKKTKCALNSSQFRIPPTDLTFFFTVNGQAVDRHISNCIQKAFSAEKVKRLQNKPTQGFLWRIMAHVTVSWKTLQLHKGFFRSLLGMSNSHTRNIYKSTPYRTGHLNEFLSSLSDPEQKNCIASASIGDQIKYLVQCPWCKSCQNRTDKGNRRHHSLHCTHPKIVNFKSQMNNTIASMLDSFFKDIANESNEEEMISLIVEISNSFQNLQKSQVGRMKKLSKDRNILYLTIERIIEKLEGRDILTTIHSHPIAFYLDLFHITPDKLFSGPTDEETGVLDTVWMGLMPKAIADTIYKRVKEMSNGFTDKEDGTWWKEHMIQCWKRIESINMGRATGIHRILNGIGTEREEELIEKFSLQDLVMKRERNCRKSRRKVKPTDDTQLSPSPNRKKRKLDNEIKIRCNGITCGLEKIRWCSKSNFHPNSIPATRKQCLRCSLFVTAMKSAASLLIDIQQMEATIQIKFITILREKSRKKRIEFTSLMNMLKKFVPTNEQFTRAQYISKNRPTEKWKRICKLLLDLSARNRNVPISPSSTTKTIQEWIHDIEQTIEIKNTELKLDNVFLRKCMQEFQKDLQPTIINDIPLQNQNHRQLVEQQKIQDEPVPKATASSTNKSISEQTQAPTIVEILSDTPEPISAPDTPIQTTRTLESITDKEKETILRAKLELMNRRSYLSGGVVLLAIEVLRDKYSTSDIFLACTEAAQIILAWNPNEGWKRFARIFYSNAVCNEKPNGLYIIPVFSENHWSVVAIEKKRRFRKAVIIDSLGTSSTDSRLIRLITQAFTPNRGRVHWETPTSRRQNGVECGARTICTMMTLAEYFSTNMDFNRGIRAATLIDEQDTMEYDQMQFRRRAATCVGKYRERMKSRAIRLRQWR